MRTRIAVALVSGALALAPVFAVAAEASDPLEQLVVEMAQTSGEHMALAKHFRAKAEEARAEATRHTGMARTYGAGKLTQRQQMKKHCDGLSEKFNGLAQEYEALAKLHEDAAKGAQ